MPVPAHRDAVGKAYGAWGLDIPADGSTTSAATMASVLERIAKRIPDTPCRVTPSSFDPLDSTLRAMPRSLSLRWTSCVQSLRLAGSRGVMMRLPLFFQLEQLLFLACKEVGSFVFVNDVGNMPLGAAAIERGEIDTVVTTAEDAEQFILFLLGRKAQLPRTWLTVENAATAKERLSSVLAQASVAREVHLFPGMPILIQCAECSHEAFHAHESCLIELSGSHTYISTGADEPLPLVRFDAPLPLTQGGTCACGKPIFLVQR